MKLMKKRELTEYTVNHQKIKFYELENTFYTFLFMYCLCIFLANVHVIKIHNLPVNNYREVSVRYSLKRRLRFSC